MSPDLTTFPTESSDLRLESVESLLAKDELLRKIEALYGLSTIRTWKLDLYNAGKRFKQIFKLQLSDGSREVTLILKFHKRNVPDRFHREVSPRVEEDFIPFAPAFLGSYSQVSRTGRNQAFQNGDYRVIVEDFIDGIDLIDVFTSHLSDDSKLMITEKAAALYETIGEQSFKRGWQLSNVSPRNVRLPKGSESPLIVDWGGQTTDVDPNAYRELIRDRIWECFLNVGVKNKF